MSIFIKKAEFSDDDTFIMDNPKYSETFVRDYISTDFTLNAEKSSTIPIAWMVFWSSNNLLQNTRKYQKIDQVLANLSGSANFLILICFFLLKIEQRLAFIRYLMMDLYDYESDSDNDTKITIKSHNLIKSESPENNHITNNDIEIANVIPAANKQSDQKTLNENEKLEPKKEKQSCFFELSDFKNAIEKKNNKPHPLKDLHSFKYLKIKFKLLFKFSLNPNEITALKFEEEYFKITNLNFIFKLNQDFEKMKIVNFNENQIKLFSFLPNPKICPSYARKTSDFQQLFILSREIFKEEKVEKDSLEVVKNLVQININKPNKIDMKLIKLLS